MDCTLKLPESTPYTAEVDTCPVDWAKNTILLFREQLCGKSLFCREGLAEIHRIIEDISIGEGKSDDTELIRELCLAIVQVTDCESSKNRALHIAQALKEHLGTWEMHIKRKRCTALVCNKLLTFYIDAAKCTACGSCLSVCPANAIDGAEGMYHVIDNDSCLQCGCCYAACPAGAVKKATAGAVLPKLPEKPGTIGTFKSGLGGLKRGLRASKLKN